jgi:monoamine oxidase
LIQALDQLEKMFGRELRSEYVEGKLEAWHKHRYSKMGYSYLPVGAMPELRLRLAAPVAPTLYFAGEATNVRAPSTVHGALESGQRAARQILSRSLIPSA